MSRPCVFLISAALAFVVGCQTPGRVVLSPQERAVADAARPILTLDPDAVWTDSFNRLVELGPAAVDYLMRQSAITESAAPDSLETLLHTSLVRMLASPDRAPKLTTACLETKLGVLHFDLKVAGDRIGTVVMRHRSPPRLWHDLYPLDFDHKLAGRVNLNADRQALITWWQANRGNPAALVSRPLTPNPDHLWRVLGRRYADRWQYQPEPRAILVSSPPVGSTLIDVATYEYNFVRAACIWLGAHTSGEVRSRLIDLVGSRSPVLSYNARFALSYSRDERIRALIREYSRDKSGD